MAGSPTLRHSNDTALNTLIRELDTLSLDGNKSVCIFSSTKNDYDVTQLDSYLKQFPMTIFGGAFTNIVHSGTVSERGFVIAAYDTDFPVSIFADLNKEVGSTNLLNGHSALVNQQRFLVLIDGPSNQVDSFITTIGNRPRLGNCRWPLPSHRIESAQTHYDELPTRFFCIQ